MREGRSGESMGTRSGWDFSDSLELVRDVISRRVGVHSPLICGADLLLGGILGDS